MARPSSQRGTTAVMMATLLACSKPAPIAWKMRAPIRNPRVGAKPQRAEPVTKTRKPPV
jgi:hypothetical protein